MAASIRDVARLAGVSLGTVSNVLNTPDMVSQKTLEKVQAAITKLGFVRNDAARQLRAGKSNSIAMVILDASNPFYTEIAMAAETKADELGYSLIAANSATRFEREKFLVEVFEQQRVNGILVSPSSQDFRTLREIRDRGTPIILVDSISPDGEFSSVSVDDVAGGRMAVEHLLAVGKNKIAFVGAGFDIPQVADRLLGAQKALLNSGKQLQILDAGETNVPAGRRIGNQILQLPNAERPDAIFAVNDLLAIGIMQAIIVDGSLSIPSDIALIGYDDIEFSETAIVPLSSISQSTDLIGANAVDLLADYLEDKNAPSRQFVIQPELIARESTTGNK